MLRSLLVAAVAGALIIPAAADAATTSTHKRHIAHHNRIMRSAPAGLYGGNGYRHANPGFNRTPGPPWSGPNQCWEDLGYGRYESCDQ